MAKIVAVSVSREKGTVKTPVDEAVFIENYGIEGDAHAGDWHRQVSLLADESIEKVRQTGLVTLSPGRFAENLTTVGIELHTLPIGQQMRIGEVVLEVTQIGKECHHGCEIKQLVGDCVMPREGIFAKVVKGGTVKAGEVVELL